MLGIGSSLAQTGGEDKSDGIIWEQGEMGGIENSSGANHPLVGWFERNWAQCGNAHDWTIRRGLVITFGRRLSMRKEGVPTQLKNRFSNLWKGLLTFLPRGPPPAGF